MDGCLTKAPCGGRKLEEARWREGRWHQALDGGGRLGHPAGRRDRCGQSSHDSPLLVPALETVSEALGALPEGTSVHLDRGYDSRLTRERLEDEPY